MTGSPPLDSSQQASYYKPIPRSGTPVHLQHQTYGKFTFQTYAGPSHRSGPVAFAGQSWSFFFFFGIFEPCQTGSWLVVAA